jgi:hypothetical protein
MSAEEQAAVLRLLKDAHRLAGQSHSPYGYNIA